MQQERPIVSCGLAACQKVRQKPLIVSGNHFRKRAKDSKNIAIWKAVLAFMPVMFPSCRQGRNRGMVLDPSPSFLHEKEMLSHQAI